MKDEGLGTSKYKRKEFNISLSNHFFVAVRVNQTIDDTFFKTQWRFDNIKVFE